MKNLEIQTFIIRKSRSEWGFDYYSHIEFYTVKGDIYLIIPLPTPPEKEKIQNYELPKRDQKWMRAQLPVCWTKQFLIRGAIERGTEKDPDEKWYLREPTKEQQEWSDEMWRRRSAGHWFFNNGVAVFLTGDHWFYLQEWVLENGARPEFRDRQWAISHALDFVRMTGIGLGVILGKMRREGATGLGLAKGFSRASMEKKYNFGIMSKVGSDAKKAFRRIVSSMKKTSPYFEPSHSSGSNPQKKITFTNPSFGRGKKNLAEKWEALDNELESWIEWESTTNGAFDGLRISWLLADEQGKKQVKDYNLLDWWEIHKFTLMEGIDVVGQAFLPTTVAEMDRGGGDAFKILYYQSNHLDRNDLGETESGLVKIFIPAIIGYNGFVDEYGMSVVNEPTPEQVKYLSEKFPKNAHLYKRGIGSKKFFELKHKDFDKSGNTRKKNAFRRQNPLNEYDMFLSDSKECHFDPDIIQDRMRDLDRMRDETGKQPWRKYTLVWNDDSDPTKGVTALPDRNGKWKIKDLGLFTDRYNRVINDLNGFTPANTDLFAIGIDPMGHTKSTDLSKIIKSGEDAYAGDEFGVKGKFSNAAIHVGLKFQPMMRDDYGTTDAEKVANGQLQDIVSNNFICEYIGRPRGLEILWNDIIMTAWFFGCKVLPETNKGAIIEAFRQRKMTRFLEYKPNMLINSVNLPKQPEAGVYNSTPAQMAMLEVVESFVLAHGHKMPFRRTLKDWLELDIKEITHYDAFVSSALCLIAMKSSFYLGNTGGKPGNQKPNLPKVGFNIF